MINLNPTLTAAGLALFTGQSDPGFNVAITDIAFGSQKYDPSGYETALHAEIARYPIDGSALISPSSIQVGVLMTNTDATARSPNNQWIGEIGFYVEATLFAVLSHAQANLFYKSPDIDIPVTYVLDFSVLPPGSITVNNDALSSSIALASSYAQTAAATALNSLVAIRASYYGTFAVAPTTRLDGSPRQAGDRYFDSVALAEKTFNGSIWYIPNIDSAALAASSGAGLVGIAVGRTQADKNLEMVSAPDFAAVGDGVTDDTAKFAAFESGTTGVAVDLVGLEYLVTTIPNGNDYFNGAFKVSTSVYQLNRNPHEHPLANPVMHGKAIMSAEGKYRGLSTAAFHKQGSARIVIVYREALGHGAANNVPIYCAETDDAGDRFDNVRIIAQQSNADIRNWASGMMGNGRMGILAARNEVVGNTYLDSLFIYSDDDGQTWNTANVVKTSATWDSHSRIYPYPASVGGHDTLGFILYSYTTSHGICAMKTVDNGATWTEVLSCVLPTASNPLSEAASLSEMSVSRVGTGNKWVMVVRTNQETAVSTSVNMTTWTNAKLIQSTTINKMLANPPELTYADGKFWLWSFSRRGSKEIYTDYANALMVSEGNPAAVFASGGATGWKQWRVVSALSFWPSGYMNHFTVRGRPYALCTTGEDTAGSQTSRQCVMTLLGPDMTVAMAPRAIMKLIPKPNLYPGGDFRHFPIATAIVSGASRVQFAPQMSFARNGGVAGATIVRLAGNRSEYKLRVRRDDGDVSVAPINISLAMLQADSFPLREEYVTVSFNAGKSSGFSAAAGFLTVRMRSTTSSAEGVVGSTSGTLPVGDTVVQSSGTGVTLSELWQRYELAIGPFAADINQAQLQMFWTPVGTALNDYFEFEDLKIEVGKIQTPFQRHPIAQIKAWADRFMRVFDMPTISGRQFRHMDPPMHRAPTVTLSRGTLIANTVDYITVDDVANSVTSVVAIAPM